MAECRTPGPVCGTSSGPMDDGTLCRSSSPAPEPLGVCDPSQTSTPAEFLYSPAVRVTVEVPFSIAPGMTWDGFWRLIYDRANAGIQQQANLLLEQGRISVEESRALVNSRNDLLLRIRSKATPFGELYSEILKPRSSLKSFERFVAEKGSIEAVLKSVGKTRAVVDKIGVVSRVAGPAAIVLEISLTAIVIQQADPRDRSRVAAREIGGVVGSVGGGLGGMWAGCAGLATLASPSLVVPVVGEISTGGACLIGGILGGIGVGWLGRRAGESIGEGLYEITNDLGEFQWSGNR